MTGHLIIVERDQDDGDVGWYGPYDDFDAAEATCQEWRRLYPWSAFSIGRLFDSPAVFEVGTSYTE